MSATFFPFCKTEAESLVGNESLRSEACSSSVWFSRVKMILFSVELRTLIGFRAWHGIHSTFHCNMPDENFSGICTSKRSPSVPTGSNDVRL